MARTVDEGVQEAHAVIEALAGLGIHMDEVTQKLEDEGVAAFEKSFDELLAARGEGDGPHLRSETRFRPRSA